MKKEALKTRGESASPVSGFRIGQRVKRAGFIHEITGLAGDGVLLDRVPGVIPFDELEVITEAPAGAFVIGQKVMHANNETFTVAAIFPDWIKLDGVPNLVKPQDLEAV